MRPHNPTPDPDDRHVVAAAIRGEADIILTANLKDFPTSALGPHGLEAEHPDTFFVRLCRESPDRFLEALERVRARLRNPPVSPDEHLDALRRAGLNAAVREVLAATPATATAIALRSLPATPRWWPWRPGTRSTPPSAPGAVPGGPSSRRRPRPCFG